MDTFLSTLIHQPAEYIFLWGALFSLGEHLFPPIPGDTALLALMFCLHYQYSPSLSLVFFLWICCFGTLGAVVTYSMGRWLSAYPLKQPFDETKYTSFLWIGLLPLHRFFPGIRSIIIPSLGYLRKPFPWVMGLAIVSHMLWFGFLFGITQAFRFASPVFSTALIAACIALTGMFLCFSWWFSRRLS